MARDHAAPTSDAFGGHPEAHGDPVGFDSDGRAYYVCGKDVRVYAWEKPIGKGWKEPGFATVCAHAAECRSLAESLSGKKSGKDKALREYLVEQHLPPHDAEEEKARRAARAEKAREERAIRAANKAKYDALDRKRRSHRDENRGGRRAKTKGGGGGRGAGRGGGDRRRAGRGATDGVLAMDAPPAAAQTRGGARRDEPRDVRRRPRRRSRRNRKRPNREPLGRGVRGALRQDSLGRGRRVVRRQGGVSRRADGATHRPIPRG